MAAALLGISSVTGIWKKGGATGQIKTEVKVDEQPTSEEDPCKTCIHNKEKETA